MRGGTLVHLFVIGASITIMLFSVLGFNCASIPKNGFFIYAVDIGSLIEQGNTAYDQGKPEEAI